LFLANQSGGFLGGKRR